MKIFTSRYVVNLSFLLLAITLSLSFFCFFFFQAEDGIRDVAVTGVQTCALPISPWAYIDHLVRANGSSRRQHQMIDVRPGRVEDRRIQRAAILNRALSTVHRFRSEERRVGKECRLL